MAVENRTTAPGTEFVARDKGETHTCIAIEEEGELHFRLPDGRTFKSPSGAARALVQVSANGWRFWSLPDDEGQPSDRPPPREAKDKPKRGRTKKAKRLLVIKMLPNQKGVPEGSTRWFCSACMEAFTVAGSERPAVCLRDHEAETVDDLA